MVQKEIELKENSLMQEKEKLVVIYASEGGNAWDVADNVSGLASQKGIDSDQREMNDVSVTDLQSMRKVVVICSTTGDGDIPMTGENFWEELRVSEVDLKGLEYSVCALGDSSFPHFCGAGKQIDHRLMELSAKRVTDRQEIDRGTDGWQDWAEKTIKALGYD